MHFRQGAGVAASNSLFDLLYGEGVNDGRPVPSGPVLNRKTILFSILK